MKGTNQREQNINQSFPLVSISSKKMDWSRGHTIGRGSSATVSFATSRLSGDIFAVKSAEFMDSNMLQREQKFLSTLCSPYIVGYIGNDITRENNKLIYNLLMEYAPGGTLFDAIQGDGGRLDESAMRYYTSQILQGLEYLHSSGIAHCDIKSSNILIGDKGIKIADLGCAKWINSDSQEVIIGGTPMFMAPEVARGEEQRFPADIWALGCILIEMATGDFPWPHSTDPVSVLYKIGFSGNSPDFPDCLSGQAKDFLSKCLSRDPKERWTAKQLLKHPFLENYNSFSKPIQEFNTSSPTSTLDQHFWNSMEDSRTLVDEVQTSSSNCPENRIRRISLISGGPSWDWDENWITIRCNMKDDYRNVAGNLTGVCGSMTYMEMESSGVGGEELELNFSQTSVRCNNCSGNFFMAFSFPSTEQDHSAVLCSDLNFERLEVNQALLL